MLVGSSTWTWGLKAEKENGQLIVFVYVSVLCFVLSDLLMTGLMTWEESSRICRSRWSSPKWSPWGTKGRVTRRVASNSWSSS